MHWKKIMKTLKINNMLHQDFGNIQTTIAEFSNTYFGKDRNATAPLHHLLKEIKEVKDAYKKYVEKQITPNLVELKYEYADMTLLLLDAAAKCNISATAMYFNACKFKSIVNDISNTSNPTLFEMIDFYTRDTIKKLTKSELTDMQLQFDLILACIIKSLNDTNISSTDLIKACNKKIEINKKRTWGKPDENGVCHHV